MPVVAVASEPVHYRRSGGTGPPLLLVHGSGGSLRHWPKSLRGSREVDAVCVDLPGHGRSGGVGRSRVKDYADWLSAFAEALASPIRNIFKRPCGKKWCRRQDFGMILAKIFRAR